VAEQYIPEQKYLKKWIGSATLKTQRYNFQHPIPTLSAILHSVTDRQTYRWTTYRANGPSYYNRLKIMQIGNLT